MKLKQWQHISCDCKCKFNSATCNSKQNGIIKYVNVNAKNFHKCEKGYSWNLFILDEIVIVMKNLSTEKINIIATNVTSTASINCHSKKVRDWNILHTVLLAIILLLIITIMCYHYAKQKGIM